MEHIVKLIEQTAVRGTVIPKPEVRGDSIVKCWGRRRGERALVYKIPNHKDRKKPYAYEKGITESEWVEAHNRLNESGEITRKWFRCAMAQCNAEGSCNFTTIGGVFELLGVARYVEARYLCEGVGGKRVGLIRPPTMFNKRRLVVTIMDGEPPE